MWLQGAALIAFAVYAWRSTQRALDEDRTRLQRLREFVEHHHFQPETPRPRKSRLVLGKSFLREFLSRSPAHLDGFVTSDRYSGKVGDFPCEIDLVHVESRFMDRTRVWTRLAVTLNSAPEALRILPRTGLSATPLRNSRVGKRTGDALASQVAGYGWEEAEYCETVGDRLQSRCAETGA